jgi:adenine phosphoribosyltransferase
MDIKAIIRTIPDHPRPGVMFRDITTLLADARAFRTAVDLMVQPYAGVRVDRVAAIEARGFILGGAVAHQLSVGFTPIRKKGKLPARTVAQSYALEYGEDVVEMHADALNAGERVLIVDDLIATGGTALAAAQLIENLGAQVIGASFVIDLPELGGAEKLRARGIHVDAICSFEGG